MHAASLRLPESRGGATWGRGRRSAGRAGSVRPRPPRAHPARVPMPLRALSRHAGATAKQAAALRAGRQAEQPTGGAGACRGSWSRCSPCRLSQYLAPLSSTYGTSAPKLARQEAPYARAGDCRVLAHPWPGTCPVYHDARPAGCGESGTSGPESAPRRLRARAQSKQQGAQRRFWQACTHSPWATT